VPDPLAIVVGTLVVDVSPAAGPAWAEGAVGSAGIAVVSMVGTGGSGPSARALIGRASATAATAAIADGRSQPELHKSRYGSIRRRIQKERYPSIQQAIQKKIEKHSCIQPRKNIRWPHVRRIYEKRLATTGSRDLEAAARGRLIETYLPLVRSTASRFAGRGERLEDLVQVGTIGLIGAIDRRDPTRSTELTSYVARCVEGEIRRHLRDRCAIVRIPRRIQSETLPVAARPPVSLEERVDDEIVAPCEPLEDLGIARAMVTLAARSLDRRERHIVGLRYFGDLSQAEIGIEVGLSQVHVSRLLHGAIAKMRARLEIEEDRAATSG
jgi:RNA polymerase sigma-B factor